MAIVNINISPYLIKTLLTGVLIMTLFSAYALPTAPEFAEDRPCLTEEVYDMVRQQVVPERKSNDIAVIPSGPPNIINLSHPAVEQEHSPFQPKLFILYRSLRLYE